MTAVAKLPEKWREEAADHDRHKDPLPASILRECADELTAALSPAELGGVPVAWMIDAEFVDAGKVRTFSATKPNPDMWGKATFTPLYSTPRAAEAVSEEVFAVVRPYLQPEAREKVRAALTAALTPPSAKGEKES